MAKEHGKTIFSYHLQMLRHKALMTQSELAKLSGIPLGTLRAWESGVCIPKNANYKKFKTKMRNSDMRYHEEHLANLDKAFLEVKSKRAMDGQTLDV